MIGRLLLLLFFLFLLWWILRWFRRTPAQQFASLLQKMVIWGGGALILLLVLSGRLNPLFAALASAVPVVLRGIDLLKILPWVQRFFQNRQASAERPQVLRTRLLEIHRRSDAMDGLVLQGDFQGRRLSSLSRRELHQLHRDYLSEDPVSADLLELYLHHRYGPRWQDTASQPNAMTREEALAILGLGPTPTPEEIRRAHRRLIQRLHPDLGGSDYLAAKINAAKQLLL